MDNQLLQHFVDASVQGIPLLVVVIAAVQWTKSVGVQGNGLRVASLVIGVVLGTGYQVAVIAEPLPATGLGWFALGFAIVVYGLALGLVASTTVDLSVDLLAKALGQLGVRALSAPLPAELTDSDASLGIAPAATGRALSKRKTGKGE